MYYHSISCLVLFFLVSLFHHLPSASSKQDLGLCETLFQCGNITAGFPFWGGNRDSHCGHPLLKLHCNKNSSSTSLIISHQEYSVFYLDQTFNTIELAKANFLLGSFCSSAFNTTTLPPDIFELSPTYKSLTVFYHCDSLLPSLSSYTCPDKGAISVSENPDSHGTCRASFTINVPTGFVTEEKRLNMTNLESVLKNGFEAKVVVDEKPCQQCSSSHGRCDFNQTLTQGFHCRALNSAGSCGYNQSSSRFVCNCKDPYSLSCSHSVSHLPTIIGSIGGGVELHYHSLLSSMLFES